MLFVLLISLSATCFAFASGLATILASNLGGVPDNARVMGCTCANSPSKYSSTTLDGIPSRASRPPQISLEYSARNFYVHYPESHSDTLFPATSLALRFRPQVNPSSAQCVVLRAISCWFMLLILLFISPAVRK